jgi:hypothetical protein
VVILLGSLSTFAVRKHWYQQFKIIKQIHMNFYTFTSLPF